MRECLTNNEKVLSDAGHGEPHIVHGSVIVECGDERARRLRAGHEQINGRLKSFSCLLNRWQHDLHIHKHCFFAVALIIELKIGTTGSK